MAKPASMAPIYLICGEDELKRASMVKRLETRFASTCDLDFNRDLFSGEQSKADEVITACMTMPFDSPQRLVILKDTEKLAKDDLAKLVAYCMKPAGTTVFCLVAAKLAKNTVLYKTIASSYPKSIVDCTPKVKKELPDLVRGMAVVHGVTIAPSAIELLISLVGEQSVRLDSELAKIAASLEGRDLIRDEDVRRLCARTAQVKPWEFVDALAARDCSSVLRTLGRMEDQSPFGLLALSTARLRDLIATKAIERRGQSSSLSSILGRPDWQVRKYRGWAAHFEEKELRDALKSALETEKRMKSGADQNLTFENWALSVCVRSPHKKVS